MWGTITNLFSSPPADETEDTNHDRADEESFEIEQAEFIMERPLQRRLSAANLLSSNGQSEEAYDPRQVKTPRCFAKFSPTVSSPLAMILIGRGHRFGDSLDDLERVAKGCIILSKFYIV
jgi:hypothetical protein